jgi:hypothetical protein
MEGTSMHEIKVAVMVWAAAVLVGLGLIACVSGCASVCDVIKAEVPVVNAKLADVQRAISEVERSGVREQIASKEAQAEFDKGLAMAKEGYTLAVQSNALASSACSDSRNYLEMIARGWTLLRPFLALVGGTNGSPVIADPLVWEEYR